MGVSGSSKIPSSEGIVSNLNFILCSTVNTAINYRPVLGTPDI